ncbi:hypothetical protein CORT_0A03460 [Candida orthopsilosis Co 90-125]|uniref:Tethering factor for nuclear proteasome STS1 n=1 Tax=Candida orthopsilosis (strain 90-125) TaxID=1136231 RepID=H8WWB0_CANO9|nr:hypothetical protein CORT_0A03460 [Candida orthopsilosis Co 90-125]CCG20734.1 hypothetical protein CORT_0A03460 [Candida orthopsilosis Co 90-125]
MMSAGFQWGINNNNNSTSGSKAGDQMHFTSSQQQHYTPRSLIESSLSKKRKRRDEGDTDTADDEKQDDKQSKSFTLHDKLHNCRKQFNFTSSNNNTTSSLHKNTTTTATSFSTKYKRSRTPRIIGQPLPPTRIIETLDKSDLTKLIYSLIDIHPELNQTISKIAQPPSITNILTILNAKYETLISALPYKCDASSDYSYLRIKPYLVDFLNCLEDYILWILPPNQHDDLVTSLWFLHESTNLIHKLPNFTNSEFQYTRNLTYETIINCWIILFNQDLANDAIFQIFRKQRSTGHSNGKVNADGEEEEDADDDELIEKLRVHQRYCSKFGQLIEIYQEKLHQYKLAMNEQYNNRLGSDGAATGSASAVGNGNGNGDGTVAANARLNEFVTVDYSQYSLSNPFR